MAGVINGGLAENLRLVISDIVKISDFRDFIKKDCTDLGRRISLLSHLVEEIIDSGQLDNDDGSSSSSTSSSDSSCLFDLLIALQDAKRLLLAAGSFDPNEVSSDLIWVPCLSEFNAEI